MTVIAVVVVCFVKDKVKVVVVAVVLGGDGGRYGHRHQFFGNQGRNG